MDRQSFSTANVPTFDDSERADIQASADRQGLDTLRCPRDGSPLLTKLTDDSLHFAVQCLECQRWALTLRAPRADE